MEPNTPKNSDRLPNFKPKFSLYWIYGLILLFFIASMFYEGGAVKREIPYSKFEKALQDGCVGNMSVTTSQNIVEAEIKPDCAEQVFGEKAKENEKPVAIIRIPSVSDFSKYISDLTAKGLYTGETSYKEGKNYLDTIFFSVLPFLLLIGFFIFMSRRMASGGGAGGGVFNVGKSKAQLFDKGSTQIKVSFKDVAGLAGAKQEVEEIVSFLRNPSKYTELGGKIPKGALLVGPPGTGKTLLAKAVAGEADVPFFTMSGSDFVEMFVGVGASRVRDLFRQAKEKAPCIIFIDEIDAVGRARGKNPNMGSNDERENTLNQLLTEMDGFGTNSGVIILAATNRADILDKALLRAGRFDRQIHVDLPDVQERHEIFMVHLRNLKMDDSVDVDFLSRQTPGFSGADIANVCNEAALIAARKNKSVVQKQDFLDAVDRIVGGLEKKTKITTVAEKRAIAYHEAGHATISWKLEHANPLVKVTIVPRGEALGAAWYLPEERQLTTREHIYDELCATLGGRAAEDIFFHTASTGAINDLERVTKSAYAMVAYYGMSDKLSNLSFYDSSNSSDFGFTKPYSEKTAELIDSEAKAIVNEQYERAKGILTEFSAEHNKLAEILIEKEVLFADDLERIFGPRPWKSRADELLAKDEAKLQELPTAELPSIEASDDSVSESNDMQTEG